MARPVRIQYPGAVYHVITRGNNRQRIFKNDQDRKTYLEKLLFYCDKKQVRLLCYCLLSNHVHLLLETPEGNLSSFMQAFQTSYTVYFNRRHRHTGHVFEQRYKAFLVDKDNYLLQVSRYIHLNPVGAEMVERPQDYRWSSYREYVRDGKVVGVSRELILEQFGARGAERISGYRDFVEGSFKRGEDCFELPITKQAFVGDESFAKRAAESMGRDQGIRGRCPLEDVVEAVCQVMRLQKQDIRRALRQQPVKRAREVLMYVARQHSDASLREIAAYLGARDISTVSHGVRRVEEWLAAKGDNSREIERAIQKIHSLIQA